MKKFIQEFKEFALKGNIIDMAVGVIIGGAFGKIVSGLVDFIISPLLALLTKGATLDSLSVTLREAVMNGEEVVSEAVKLNYGAFLQAIIDFIIIALCLFLVLKGIMAAKNKLESMKKKEEEAAVEEAPADTELSVLLEIKELLEKK
jgi:large conductance mechanosensitive channel